MWRQTGANNGLGQQRNRSYRLEFLSDLVISYILDQDSYTYRSLDLLC